MNSTLFGKFTYAAGAQDRDNVILDTARTDALFQIPHAPDREALGQDDVQREDGTVTNLTLL